MRRKDNGQLTMWTCSASRAGLDPERLAAFALRYLGGTAGSLSLEVRPLRGGLESAGVFRVEVRTRDSSSKWRMANFVVKRASGRGRRELQAYETLLSRSKTCLAPRLLGSESLQPATSYLYLEWITPWLRWPWQDSRLAALVLEQLAYVHADLSTEPFSTGLAEWDFEAELLQTAWRTLEFLESVTRQMHLASVRRSLPSVRRVVAALPAIRRQLVAQEGTTSVLHGDAHPGNVIVRRRGASREVVLLDWARTRPGSPLEDVSSWLQSLGFWEPEVRRYHDTLLRHYLAMRGHSTQLDRHLRQRYWLASACNGLAGALSHHLAEAVDAAERRLRRYTNAMAAIHDWLRIIRRADACWHH